MQISFHGAAGGVTGSCHLLRANGQTILIDCGMFQGAHDMDVDNADDFGFPPGAVDVLLLTHAHLDHCGRIPLLHRRGFDGEIISTAPTRDLARLVLLDAAHLNEEEARRRQRHGEKRPPLFDTLDVVESFDHFGRTARLGQPIQIGRGITATFFEAGHILGSASVLMEITESSQTRRVLFSGDIGPRERPLLNPPAPPSGADIVVMESTYGDRDHRALDASVQEFLDAIRDTDERGGNVIIPTFALERAQELLFFLREGMMSGRIRRSMPVFLDSPMAISATRIYRKHADAMRPEIATRLRAGKDPFDLPELHYTRDSAESMALNRIRSGAVIMAGSGMATGGRVRHHLRHNLGCSACSVIFVGFAAEGTLARIIIDGARSVRLMGDEIPVRARIHTINGFSAHAGRSDLIDWHRRTGQPDVTFLVHGEQPERERLAKGLTGRVELPMLHQSFDL